MRTLAEDRDEVNTDEQRRWIARARRGRGILPHQGALWFVRTEQDFIDGAATYDCHDEWFGTSPGDAIYFAEAWALTRNARRRDGIGRWTLDVYGDGENSPLMLTIVPMLDEVQP